jgi:hypothetical protein
MKGKLEGVTRLRLDDEVTHSYLSRDIWLEVWQPELIAIASTMDAMNCRRLRGQANRRQPWTAHSMQDTAILKSVALAVIRTRPLPWASCADRRRRPSTNWNVTCVARTARRFGAIPTSAAISSRYGRRRSRLLIRRRHSGRANDDCCLRQKFRVSYPCLRRLFDASAVPSTKDSHDRHSSSFASRMEAAAVPG